VRCGRERGTERNFKRREGKGEGREGEEREFYSKSSLPIATTSFSAQNAPKSFGVRAALGRLWDLI
jgi:hypothetical protein